jgi:hypothetical protein
MSSIVENAISSIVERELASRAGSAGASVSIPILEAPIPERPTPSGGKSPVGEQMSVLMSGRTNKPVQSSLGPVTTGPVDDPNDPFLKSVDTLSFEPLQPASVSTIAEKLQFTESTSGRIATSIFGFKPFYNVGTGTISSTPPAGLGLISALASVGQGYHLKKQREAAINAARGLPNIAVVNGEIYGEVPTNVLRSDIKARAAAMLNSMDPMEKAGGFEPAFTRIGSSYKSYVDRYAEAQKLVNPDEYAYSADFSQTIYPDEGGDSGSSGGGGGSRPATTSAGSGFVTSGGKPVQSSLGNVRFGAAQGGMLGMQEGGVAQNSPMGFVGGPPENYNDATTVADTEETQLSEGSFVINAPAVEYAGSDDIRKMILDAYSTAKEKNLDIGRADRKLYESNIDVALSKGEVVVPPELVKIIGLDRLEKINNRGKKEVTRRQKQARQGGFIDGYADGGDVVEGVGGVDAILKAYGMYKDKMPSPEIAREKTEDIMEWMPAEDILTLVMMGEASVLGDKGMRGVGHVVINRTNSNFEDFADQETIKDVLRKRTKSNIFQFNALEPTPFRRTLKAIAETEYGRKKFQRLRDAAEEILYGVEDDFTKGAVFFWNPEKSTDEDFKQKVKSGQYVPTGEARGKSSMHQYLAPRM